jgi:hypothetical protein
MSKQIKQKMVGLKYQFKFIGINNHFDYYFRSALK